MNSKMTLLASAAVAVMSLTNVGTAVAGPWYVNVAAGANWVDDSRYSGEEATSTTFFFETDPSIGFVISGAVGYDLGQMLKGLRVEGELAYRENNVHGRWSSAVTGTTTTTTPTTNAITDGGALDIQHTTFSIMANAWYDFQVMGLNPYVGGGIGWADVSLDGKFDSKHAISASESGFAWQLGAGLNFDIEPGMKLGIGYRYLQGPDVTLHAPGDLNPETGDIDDQNHSLTVGLTVGL